MTWLRFAQDANSVATQAPASLNDFVDAVERVQEGNGLKEIKCALAEPVFGQARRRACRRAHGHQRDRSGFLSNNAGGLLGGISFGQDIVASIALKPTSSIVKPDRKVDVHGNEVTVATKGRHDPCVGVRAVPIAEAMTALVLMDHLLCDRGQIPR